MSNKDIFKDKGAVAQVNFTLTPLQFQLDNGIDYSGHYQSTKESP